MGRHASRGDLFFVSARCFFRQRKPVTFIMAPCHDESGNKDEVDYELTTRHAPFKGTVVSRRSVADLIASIIDAPDLHRHANLGVNKPNTDGDKPYFM